MTIIIPEFWLWVAVAAMSITTIFNIIQIRIARQHTKLLQERLIKISGIEAALTKK